MAVDEGAVRRRTVGDPWRAVLAASPVATAITREADGRILFINPAFLQMLGWTEVEVVGRTLIEAGFWPAPDDRAQMLEQLRCRRGVRDLEHTVTTRGGDTIVALTSISKVELNGEACLVGHVHDITERRRLEDELRESEERFRQITEALEQGFLLRDVDPPTVLYASPAMARIFGLDRATLYRDARSAEKLIHPEDRRQIAAARDAMTTTTRFEYRIVRPDGQIRWIRTRAEPVRIDDGHMTRLASVSEDITEERELRDALHDSERRFRLLAENSTDVIAQSAPDWTIQHMSPASRALYGYEPEEMVGRPGWEFVHPDDRAALSDELAQAVSPVKDVTNVYRVRRKDGRHVWVEAKTVTLRDAHGEVREFHTSARDISERTPLHAILGFGELRLSLEPVHVGAVISESVEMVAPLAAARSIALSVASPQEVDCHVLADRHRLKQVLLNLLSNAVKYNCDGGKVRVCAAGRDSEQLRITVSDSGIGIAPDNLSRVFTPFERLGAETTEVEGTGLGLTLTKRLIEKMGGDIGVESEVGRGTTFWVTLPVVAAPQALPVAPADTSPGTDAQRRLPARTVLYIEDNPSNIKLAECILAMRPEVTLLVATQGGLGLDLAREHRPAVVLLDLNLPDMSGEQVLRRIRGDPRTEKTTVVVLSADATPGQVARLRRAGADHYLTKPFEIERFLALVDGARVALPAADPSDGHDASAPLLATRVQKLRRLYPDRGSLGQFVEQLLEDIRERIEVLERAAHAGDAPAVWQAAHAMRGTCGIAGAHRVEALLAEFEAIARRDEIPDADGIARLRAGYGDVAQALARELS